MRNYGITLWSVGSVIPAGVVLAVVTVRQRTKTNSPPNQLDLAWSTRETSELLGVYGTGPRGRRKAYRRAGNPTRVQLIGLSGAPFHGWVLNRSPLGIGLAVDRPVAPGCVFLVLPSQAPVGTPAVEGVAQWRRKRLDHHDLGCQFTGPLPPRLPLLFG